MNRQREYISYFLLVISLVALVLVMLPTFVREDHRQGTGLECYDNIRRVGGRLMDYAERHGNRLPTLGSEKEESTSQWTHTVSGYLRGRDRELFLRSLKCPRDTSRACTSYELNPALAGRSLSYVREHDQLWLLREKDYAGSHRHLYFADGHTRRAPDQNGVR